jgi:polyisoprenoid-binding protein YceI
MCDMTTTVMTDLEQLTGTYTVDPSHSRLGFVARHAMVAKVRGQFNDFAGSISVDGADPSSSRVELTIQGASVDTGDADRDGHLRSGDFLALDEYPELTFRSTAVDQLADDSFRVTGDLTIRGATRPVEVDMTYRGAATDPWDNQRIAFEGQLVIDRKDWGVSWNAALDAGGVLVSDKVTLEIEIAAIRDA